MVYVMQSKTRKGTKSDADAELGDEERVEITADYHAELSVPFTSEQLVALEAVARERGVSPVKAAQDLVARGLAEHADR